MSILSPSEKRVRNISAILNWLSDVYPEGLRHKDLKKVADKHTLSEVIPKLIEEGLIVHQKPFYRVTEKGLRETRQKPLRVLMNTSDCYASYSAEPGALDDSIRAFCFNSSKASIKILPHIRQLILRELTLEILTRLTASYAIDANKLLAEDLDDMLPQIQSCLNSPSLQIEVGSGLQVIAFLVNMEVFSKKLDRQYLKEVIDYGLTQKNIRANWDRSTSLEHRAVSYVEKKGRAELQEIARALRVSAEKARYLLNSLSDKRRRVLSSGSTGTKYMALPKGKFGSVTVSVKRRRKPLLRYEVGETTVYYPRNNKESDSASK